MKKTYQLILSHFFRCNKNLRAIGLFFSNQKKPVTYIFGGTVDGRNPAPPGMVLKPCK